MADPTPPPYQERTYGAIVFMLTPVFLVGILLAQLLAGAVGWLLAIPLAIVLSIALIALVHMGQGGGVKVIELGCSAWILAILLFFVPSVFRGVGEQRDALICRDNLRRIGEAMKLYAGSNDGLYPVENWQTVIRPLLPPAKNTHAKDPFVCPTKGGKASYFYRPPTGRPKSEAILIEESPFGKLHRTRGKTGSYFLLVNGEIRLRPPLVKIDDSSGIERGKP